MKVLNVISTLNPAFGGPVEGLRHNRIALEKLGHVANTVTLDPPGAPWIEGFPGHVYPLGPSFGKNYCFNSKLVSWLTAYANDYDVVIAHCIWQYQSLAVWRAACRAGFPYAVFAHGALDPWFKKNFPLKHLKKWFYWPWGVFPVLKGAQAILYTTEEERLLARSSFWLYRANEEVVGYGIGAPEGDPDMQREMFLNAWPELRGKHILLFLSRIDEKKGCDLLLRSFAKFAARNPDLHLVMAGPAKGMLKGNLVSLANQLGIANRITWTGMLTGDSKWGAFHTADAFVLPSHSENFGVVVAEALACGLPVLISNKVNIWREVEAAGAGLIEDDTYQGALSLLGKWLDLPEQNRRKMSEQARSCFLDNFEVMKTTDTFLKVIINITNAKAHATAFPRLRHVKADKDTVL